jgi:farnesyl-diphosphate farnesyltransferase
VIQQLPTELKDAVCVFYLVLRALDTVEDDMSMAVKVKVPALRCFHENIGDRGFKMKCEGKPTDKDLMENFCHVADAYLKLDKSMQKVIKEITNRMGNGMADFIEKTVSSIKDWDLYCHYVAGLVGVGLSQLFSASEREGGELAEMEDLANHMGLFLQKTNIIRDYLEDITEEPAPRMFWPEEIWSKYGKELSAFKEPENLEGALKCLNHMISNALAHVEPCFEYMIRLRDPQVFAFCAIPQLMAMSTLSLCFNNPEVFRGVVKMRRGKTASLIIGLNGLEGMYRSYLDCVVRSWRPSLVSNHTPLSEPSTIGYSDRNWSGICLL